MRVRVRRVRVVGLEALHGRLRGLCLRVVDGRVRHVGVVTLRLRRLRGVRMVGVHEGGAAPADGVLRRRTRDAGRLRRGQAVLVGHSVREWRRVCGGWLVDVVEPGLVLEMGRKHGMVWG